VEPEYFVPIIPMLLVNGGCGIGSGWSSNVPNFNPADCIENIKRMLDGKEFLHMQPWYRGFTGTIVGNETNTKYKTSGKCREVDNDVLLIEELPISKWTND